MNLQALLQAGYLLDNYIERYQKTYGIRPKVNAVNDKWKFHDVISHLGYDEAQALVAFYFGTQSGHDLSRFFNNYDDLYEFMQLQRRDRERSRKLREETAERRKQTAARRQENE